MNCWKCEWTRSPASRSTPCYRSAALHREPPDWLIETLPISECSGLLSSTGSVNRHTTKYLSLPLFFFLMLPWGAYEIKTVNEDHRGRKQGCMSQFHNGASQSDRPAGFYTNKHCPSLHARPQAWKRTKEYEHTPTILCKHSIQRRKTSA